MSRNSACAVGRCCGWSATQPRPGDSIVGVDWLVQVLAAGVLAGLVSVLVAAGLDSVLEDLASVLEEVAGAESFLAASLYLSLR